MILKFDIHYNTVAGYHKDTERTVWAMLSVYLYCSSGEAIVVHWALKIFQLRVNWYCNVINQARTKNVNWWNCGQLVLESRDCCANIRGGADKSLARQGRKPATANKLRIYSTHSSRILIQFLARCSNLCKPLKKSEFCSSKQVSAAVMTFASDEKCQIYNCSFSPGNRAGNGIW